VTKGPISHVIDKRDRVCFVLLTMGSICGTID